MLDCFCAGRSLYKARTGGYVLNRGKKRQVKPEVGVAWGKLISQYSKVMLASVDHCYTRISSSW